MDDGMDVIDFDENCHNQNEESQQNQEQNDNHTQIVENIIKSDVYKKNENNDFIPIGLKKLNISYVNPVLLLLSGINEFEQYFIKNTEKFMNDKKYILSFVTSRLFFNLFKNEKTKKAKVYDSSNYLNVLKIKNIPIEKDNNMNINDILMLILYNLNDELKEEKNIDKNIDNYDHYNLEEVIKYGYISYMNRNNSIITKKLNNFILQTIECPKCCKKYYEMKSFPTFNLNITEANENFKSSIGFKEISLLDCIKSETIENNKSIKFYCGICNNYIESKKVLYQFYSLSDKLIFIIEQKETRGNEYKKNIPLKINKIINLEEYAYPKNIQFNYELIGIISSEIGQNYVCFLKSYYNNKWYLYNNEQTEEKDLKDILNGHNNGNLKPHTLLYSRIDK